MPDHVPEIVSYCSLYWFLFPQNQLGHSTARQRACQSECPRGSGPVCYRGNWASAALSSRRENWAQRPENALQRSRRKCGFGQRRRQEGTVTSFSPGPRQRANDQGHFAQMKPGSYGWNREGMCGNCSPSPQDNEELADAPSGLCASPKHSGKGWEARPRRDRSPTLDAEPAAGLERRLRPGHRLSANLSTAAGTTGQPRPKAYRNARPSPARAKAGPPRERPDRDATATATSLNPSPEPFRHHFPFPGTWQTPRRKSTPEEKEGEAVMGVAKRSRSRWRGVSKTGKGGASVARRPPWVPGNWCCVLLLSLEEIFIQIFPAILFRKLSD